MKVCRFAASLPFVWYWASTALAVCSSNLLVDDYSKYASHTNSLGQYTSDDGTTTKLAVDTVNKKITFTASTSSYFYTTFSCETATTLGYNAFKFPIKGPAGAAFSLELQTYKSCSTTTYTSYYYTVPTKMTGSTLNVSVPLSVFSGANLNAIGAIVFESFTSGAWEIGSTQLVCANIQSSSASMITSSTTTTSTSSTSSSTSSTPSSTSTTTPSTSTTTTSTSSTRSSSSSTQSSTSSTTSSTSTTTTSTSSTSSPTSSSTSLGSSSTSSTSSSTSSTSSSTSTTTSADPSGSCTSFLVDDFASQSRLTFLFYNAMLQPSSDDGTMKVVTGRADTSTSVIVANNHVTLTPANSGSYFYTMFGCLKVTNIYGGIGLRISAAAGTVITVEIQTSASCTTNNPVLIDVTSSSLGWTFDGTEHFYTIPFSKFPGLDTDHMIALLFTGFTKAVTLGPIAFYCGTTGSQYPLPTTVAVVEPSSTVPATTGPSAFVIDNFANANTNNLGFWHGGDDTTTYKVLGGKLTINMKGNSDLSWYTQITGGCIDFTPNDNAYVHIAYSGSNAFTVAFQQHNPSCNQSFNPFPYTWDSVEASRYSNTANSDIYIPMSHFLIDRRLSVGFVLKGFYSTTPTVFSMIEIVKTVPTGWLVPSKLPTAPMKFACTRPNSFAFAIDDGDPQYAQQIAGYLRAANIKVTFFTVGAALLDTSTNFTNFYKEMHAEGHQIAYHSFTHPPMEGLPSLAAIDWELDDDIAAVSSQLGLTSTYFRPPFGTEGARVRQRLADQIPGAQFIEWSVDVQDWLWALSSTPEKQLVNFQSDVNSGGNLVVCHYLYASTVSYIPQFIDIAKKTGKQLMRVDQCMEDPNAPPL